MRLVIVSGLSGSGKTVALHMLEDLGFYCMDNVPATLVDALIGRTIDTGEPQFDRLAIGVDARNSAADLASLPELLRSLQNRNIQWEIIFLHAETQILLKRYRETRRTHPMREAGMSLRDAISKERDLLGPIQNSADLVIDTTQTSVYELRELIRRRVGPREVPDLSIQIESFGFKHGIPFDADFVFDVRCLPNPYWEPPLRPLTGRDKKVIDFLNDSDHVQRMYGDILQFLRNRIPEYISTNRNYLTVAIGCTGGQHRSVYMAEKIAADLSSDYSNILLRHGELPTAENVSNA